MGDDVDGVAGVSVAFRIGSEGDGVVVWIGIG